LRHLAIVGDAIVWDAIVQEPPPYTHLASRGG
jgi:hypothetical protein